jgi:hypothetical protein
VIDEGPGSEKEHDFERHRRAAEEQRGLRSLLRQGRPAPAKGIAVVACVDARLNVNGMLGLQEGDAHVIRNVGGVISDDELKARIQEDVGLKPHFALEAFTYLAGTCASRSPGYGTARSSPKRIPCAASSTKWRRAGCAK